MKKLALWILFGFLAIPLITGLVPSLAADFGGLIATISTAVLTLAPKVAVLGFVLGAVLGMFHWTRRHAWPMIKWSLIAGVMGTASTVVFAWLGTETLAAAPTAANVASQLVSKVLTGLSSGIG